MLARLGFSLNQVLNKFNFDNSCNVSSSNGAQCMTSFQLHKFAEIKLVPQLSVSGQLLLFIWQVYWLNGVSYTAINYNESSIFSLRYDVVSVRIQLEWRHFYLFYSILQRFSYSLRREQEIEAKQSAFTVKNC